MEILEEVPDDGCRLLAGDAFAFACLSKTGIASKEIMSGDASEEDGFAGEGDAGQAAATVAGCFAHKEYVRPAVGHMLQIAAEVGAPDTGGWTVSSILVVDVGRRFRLRQALDEGGEGRHERGLPPGRPGGSLLGV